MALLTQSTPTPNLRMRRPQDTRLHRAKGETKAARQKACTNKPKNLGEKTVANSLIDAFIAFKYAPMLFETGLTGKRRGALCPDFYLPNIGIYIVVTQGDSFKESFLGDKIAGAQKVNGISIMLLGQKDVEALRRGNIAIENLIRSFVVSLGGKFAFEAA